MHRERCGTAPTRVSSFERDDVVVCVVHGALTPIERALLGGEHEAAARGLRSAARNAMAERFAAAVEGLTGRGVAAASSWASRDPELVVELFVLDAPGAGDGSVARRR